MTNDPITSSITQLLADLGALTLEVEAHDGDTAQFMQNIRDAAVAICEPLIEQKKPPLTTRPEGAKLKDR